MGVNVKESLDTEKISPREENILRYVSGYILYSLRLKFKKMNISTTTKAVLVVIDSWSEDPKDKDEKSFLEYTTHWISQVDRRRLFKVNDEFYVFVRSLERCPRKVLNVSSIKKYSGENIHLLLVKEFSSSNLLDQQWNSLTKDIQNNDLRMTLRYLIYKELVNIRGYSFVKAFVDALKLKEIQNKKDKQKKII